MATPCFASPTQAAFESLCQLNLNTRDWEELQRDLSWSKGYPDYQELRQQWQARQRRAQAEELLTYQARLEAEASLQNYLDLSFILWKQHQPLAALNVIHQALHHFPNEACLYNNEAAALLQLERWSEAATSAQTALRLQPAFSLARNNLEMARARLKRGHP